MPLAQAAWAPGRPPGAGIVPELAARPMTPRPRRSPAAYPRRIDAVTDDGPFFWHFSGFGDVLSNYFDSIKAGDPELLLGERVLILLLGFAVLYAAIFLLAPFFFVRREWKVLPAKPLSALYFAAFGLGFIFFEITMIQRLVLFLGYPDLLVDRDARVAAGVHRARRAPQPAARTERRHRRRGGLRGAVRAHRVLRVGPRPADGRDAGPEPSRSGSSSRCS